MTTPITANTKVDLSPPVLEIEGHPHGDTLSLFFDEVIDEDTGDPVDLSSGYSAEMRIEYKDGTEVITLTDGSGITLGNGSILIETETSAWMNNCTVYSDLQVIPPGGNTETWMKIIIHFKKTITSPV